MKGDKVAQTNTSPNPIWQQLAGMNLSYPTSNLQQPAYGSLNSPNSPNMTNNYSMLSSMLPQISGNSGLPNNGLSPSAQSMSSMLSNLFGGANAMQTAQNGTNAYNSMVPSPQQSALTPSQSLVQAYLSGGQLPSFLGSPQAPQADQSQAPSSGSMGYKSSLPSIFSGPS